MSRAEDVAAARRAVRSVELATATIGVHFGDTVDVRRLRADVSRLSQDLDLLCGSEPAAPPAPAAVREAIADTSYVHSFWMDAEDEGLGRADRR